MDAPIGLFDSGFGGLTVMKDLVRMLPNENLIYLGDTANLPYGNKSPRAVLSYARKNAQFLMDQGIKLLIIPCHTASCHALEPLQRELPIPVIGMIEAGVKLAFPFKRIAVLGTTSTIESGLYQERILKQNPGTKILAIACPLFVPLVEEGFHEHVSAFLIVKETLKDLQGAIDAALLACTHYPLLRKVIEKELGPQVALLEPAASCALYAREVLAQKNQLRKNPQKPSYRFYATDNPEKFQKLGEIFFGMRIEKVELNKNL